MLWTVRNKNSCDGSPPISSSSSAGAPEVVSVRTAAVLQSRLQRDATEETPAGTPNLHLSSPHGALPTLPAAAATWPHAGEVRVVVLFGPNKHTSNTNKHKSTSLKLNASSNNHLQGQASSRYVLSRFLPFFFYLFFPLTGSVGSRAELLSGGGGGLSQQLLPEGPQTQGELIHTINLQLQRALESAWVLAIKDEKWVGSALWASEDSLDLRLQAAVGPVQSGLFS